MIVKSGSGYRVKSEGGKNLSRVLPTRTAAKKRLAQVEYFKHADDPRTSHAFKPSGPQGRMCAECGWPKSTHGTNEG